MTLSVQRHQPVVLLDGTAGLPREVLGSKGFGIDAMRRLGLPVPPAFCITTAVCARYFADPAHALNEIWDDVLAGISWLETETSRTFGSGPNPLLLSVRSGAAQSMPGMLDTVLNLGMNESVHRALAHTGTPAFAADIQIRFERMYRQIVLIDQTIEMPENPHVQLRTAIEAVFDSWHNPRATTYRTHHGLDERSGTAVVVQAMVFGNADALSGTGVLFSRNPMTGTDEPFGEWLASGQGEDIVSGARDPEPVIALRDMQPKVYGQLMSAAAALETAKADVQDIEFTVESGTLWLLQTRAAKRSAQATVRLALALRRDGLIDDAEALRRVTPAHVETLLRPSLQPETRFAAPLLATGLPACPGVASGTAYTDVDAAIDAAEEGEDVVLVRTSTSPADVAAMIAARAVVTEVGGATSHAAVVSRELGRPSVVGCGTGVAAELVDRQITVDGTEGEVREGILPLQAWSEDQTPDLIELADIARRTIGDTEVGSPASLVTMLTALQVTDKRA